MVKKRIWKGTDKMAAWMGSTVEAFLISPAKEMLLSVHGTVDMAEAEARALIGSPGSSFVSGRLLVVSLSE